MIETIFIPSKKRPNGKTFKFLDELYPRCSGVDIFVEKEDYPEYEKYRNPACAVHILPESNKGIAYVRQHMLDYARGKGMEFFWSLDDDIEAFSKTNSGGTPEKITVIQALEEAQEIIKKLGVAQGALNYTQFTLNKTKPFRYNKRCLIATLNYVRALEGLNYDMNCSLKEDIDFTLQILTAGKKTVICEQLGFRVPVYGTTKGGCKEAYEAPHAEKLMSKYLEVKWGRSFVNAYLKGTGRYDVKINWDKFK